DSLSASASGGYVGSTGFVSFGGFVSLGAGGGSAGFSGWCWPSSDCARATPGATASAASAATSRGPVLWITAVAILRARATRRRGAWPRRLLRRRGLPGRCPAAGSAGGPPAHPAEQDLGEARRLLEEGLVAALFEEPQGRIGELPEDAVPHRERHRVVVAPVR